ncbi:MAG: RtcB family protein [Oligosphaeraceae bacterium]|nr:RtcB family protein [Oligosphaeraceae bacterium]
MQWEKFEEGWRLPIKSWCAEVEQGALQQAENLAKHPVLERHVALMPDCHVGFGMPIGGVIAAKDALLPSAVGVDIGCGMIAVQTNLPVEKLRDMRLRRDMQNRLKKFIPVGEGRAHGSKQKWQGFERYLDENGQVADFVNDLDRRNLGTLGGGNHFIELQESDQGLIWLMIHSGSRNLGSRVERYYQKKARAYNEKLGLRLPDPELAFFSVQEKDGQDYFRDMQFALEYALENRRRMMDVFKQIILESLPQAKFICEINIHHNYAAKEQHFGQTYYIHRKGATSAKKGEMGIIPGSMGSSSYIVRGLGNPESFMSCSHGAGRVMSRTAANQQLSREECDLAMQGIVRESWKPCSGRRGKKAGQRLLDLSEAPQAYKDIDEVMQAQKDLTEIVVGLKPMSVLKG